MKNDRTNRWTSLASSLALASALALPAIAMPTAAHAQEGVQRFDIAAGDLARALQDYSAATGVQLVYSSELVADKRSPGVSGSLSRGDALARLLGGTGLMARISGNSATITPIADAVAPGEGERVLGAVRVEGEQSASLPGATSINGINGSRDVTATEGTGSYTSNALTIGSKYPAPMKDIPQSISILTSERIKDQNIQSLEDAMRQTAGISVIQGDNNISPTFYSRGFLLDSVSIDGGAPLRLGGGGVPNGAINNYLPNLDMSLYDHVEILRGAAGVFNGYGDPSGTVNLVRKKPLDHEQYQLELQAGSWSNYRVSGDATAPLALDGRVRGRVVMTWQSQHHFYAISRDKNAIIYGIAEIDLTPSTLLSGGASHNQQDSYGVWQNGLPRFRSGDSLGLPRSTALTLDWSRMNIATTELFGELHQQIGSRWVADAKYTFSDQDSFRKLARIDSQTAVDPNTLLGPNLSGGAPERPRNRQHALEFTLNGSFALLGHEQKLVAGANYAANDGGGQILYQGGIPTEYGLPFYGHPVVNVFEFDPNDARYVEPGSGEASGKTLVNKRESYGAYLNIDFQPVEKIHIIGGIRYSKSISRYIFQSYCTTDKLEENLCKGVDSGELIPEDIGTYNNRKFKGSDFSWPPSVSLRYDIGKNYSVYGGYTAIYQDQSNSLTGRRADDGSLIDLKPAAPLTGGNFEGGVKWSPDSKMINASLSGYYIEKKGVLTADPSTGVQLVSGYRACCYIQNSSAKYISYGIDADISGEIKRGLQISASYTFNYNRYKNISTSVTDSRDQPLISFAPRHMFKLWINYDLWAAGAAGVWRRLTLAGGLNAQSLTYRSGTVCTDYGPPDNNGIGACLPGYDFPNGKYYEGVPFKFSEKGWVVASASIKYRFDDKVEISLNIDNIFDKKYYQTVGNVSSGNWYGSPREFSVRMIGKW